MCKFIINLRKAVVDKPTCAKAMVDKVWFVPEEKGDACSLGTIAFKKAPKKNQRYDMSTDKKIFREPDLSDRPYNLTVERLMNLDPETLFNAWTKEFDLWFAAPGSVLMTGKVDTPFFFETEFKPDEKSDTQRHSHYGRFLKIVPDKLIKLTWVTGAGGTKGSETIVTVELIPQNNKTLLKLAHSGFPDEESKNQHRQAWPIVLEQLEKRYAR